MSGNEKITAARLTACGPVVQTIYGQLYPDGLTLTEIQELAKSRGWMRRILESIGEVK